MYTFRCAHGHETFIPSLDGADRDAQGRQYITCGYFETEEEQAARKNSIDRHSLTQVRAHIKGESNYMNAMEADDLEEWACESPAYLVK